MQTPVPVVDSGTFCFTAELWLSQYVSQQQDQARLLVGVLAALHVLCTCIVVLCWNRWHSGMNSWDVAALFGWSLLAFLGPILAATWITAWSTNHLPPAKWPTTANQGPWSQAFILRSLVWYAQWLPLPTLGLGAVASLRRPQGNGPALIGASFLAWCGVLVSHGWLVD